MIKWPKNPANGDIYTNDSGTSWRFNGKAWVSMRNTSPNTINLQFSHSSMDPVDNMSYFIGNIPDTPAQSTNSISSKRIQSSVTGRVTQVSIMTQIIGDLGSDEEQSFILRNHTKGTSIVITNGYRHILSNQLDTFSINDIFDVSKNDELEIKWVTPTFEISPTIVRHSFNVNVEY
jgi:hypothetical protein